MIISIDYDDTYTKDPLMWNWFIESALERGHTVYCITARGKQHLTDVEQTIGRVLVDHTYIIATGNHQKKQFVHDNYDFFVDVWIDDTPEAIVDQPYMNNGLGDW